jgi:phage gpG-like protein
LIRFSASVDGVDVLNRAFNRIDQFVSDFRSVWPNVAKEFYAIEEGQFASQGARGLSGKWAPLSKAYAKYKAKRFPGQTILKASTSLYESMTNPDAPDSIFRMDARELTIGTKDPKGMGHQRGAGRLPVRPIISLTEADKRKLQKSIQSGLVEFTRGLGFQVDERAA